LTVICFIEWINFVGHLTGQVIVARADKFYSVAAVLARNEIFHGSRWSRSSLSLISGSCLASVWF